MPRDLILTVGSNPLPVVISAIALKPELVHLIYTPEVERVVNRVVDLLKNRHLSEGKMVCLRNASNVSEIYNDLGPLSPVCQTSGFNYTGGTKLMATHGHVFWKSRGGQDYHASYLSANGFLYFDDRTINPLDLRHQPRLSLDEICKLHFGQNPNRPGDQHKIKTRLQLAKRIQQYVVKHGWKHYSELQPPLYGSALGALPVKSGLIPGVHFGFHAADKRNFSETGAFRNLDISELCAAIGVNGCRDIECVSRWLQGTPVSNRKKLFDDAKWLWGKWLEVWLAGEIEQATDSDGNKLFDEVHQNVTVGTEPDDFFEMDVVAVRGHRVFLFSCTTDRSAGQIKTKLWEAASRTARIGGDHARAAMVCMSTNPAAVLRTVQAEHWAGYDTLRLFGEPHVRANSAECELVQAQNALPMYLMEAIKQWVT